MAKSNRVGVIEDELFYSAEAISRETGRPLAKVKEKIRLYCLFTEPWEGDLWLTGLDWKRGLMKEAKLDTPEAKEQRRRRSGAASRKPKEDLSK